MVLRNNNDWHATAHAATPGLLQLNTHTHTHTEEISCNTCIWSLRTLLLLWENWGRVCHLSLQLNCQLSDFEPQIFYVSSILKRREQCGWTHVQKYCQPAAECGVELGPIHICQLGHCRCVIFIQQFRYELVCNISVSQTSRKWQLLGCRKSSRKIPKKMNVDLSRCWNDECGATQLYKYTHNRKKKKKTFE